jgi:hypothetical protein
MTPESGGGEEGGCGNHANRYKKNYNVISNMTKSTVSWHYFIVLVLYEKSSAPELC